MISKGASLAFVGLVGGLTAVAVAQPVDNFVNTPTNIVWEDWHDRAHVEFAQTKEATANPDDVAYYEAASLAMWSGIPWDMPTKALTSREPYLARIHGFAETIALVAPDRATGVLMVALAQSETDFKEWAFDGSCNRFGWRQKNGDRQCDSGAAFGPWSLHLDEQKRPGDPTGAECIAYPVVCAMAAYRWIRDTPTAWASLPYQRMRAAEYQRRHP